MLKYSLIISSIIFAIGILACKKQKENIIEEANNPEPCQIISIADSLCNYPWFASKFVFNCGNTIKTYGFKENNPWKNIEFPIITSPSRFLKFSDQTPCHIKGGTYFFNLNFAPFNELALKIPGAYDQYLSEYFFSTAMAFCSYKNYTPKYALVNYNLTLTALKDTMNLSGPHTRFQTGKLIIMNTYGNTIYSIEAKDYIMDAVEIDTTADLLFFRTSHVFLGKPETGFQIHDLAMDTILYSMSVDTNRYVADPQVYDDYILFPIIRFQNLSLAQLEVLDIADRKLRRILIKKGSDFYTTRIDSHKVILYRDEEENSQTVHDTVLIKDMPIIKVFN